MIETYSLHDFSSLVDGKEDIYLFNATRSEIGHEKLSSRGALMQELKTSPDLDPETGLSTDSKECFCIDLDLFQGKVPKQVIVLTHDE